MSTYQALENGRIRHLASGMEFSLPASESYGFAYEAWIAAGNSIEPPPAPAAPTQHDLDVSRYIKRAAVKDRLLAEMAADNMARVRGAVWTVPDLTALMADPQIKQVLELIGTLSFELAAAALASATNPLLTTDIKAGWVAKLQAHLYLVP